MLRVFVSLLVSLLGLSSIINAAEVTFVQSDAKLTFAMYAAPNGSNHDLKIQLTAPMSAGWGAVGIGTQMAGALMFMIYPSSNSQDVTVSIRSAPGNQKPQELQGVDYTVEKTAITDGTMMAVLTCHQCDTWSGGSLNASDVNAPWIYALGPNAPVHSDDPDTETIQQHQKYNSYFYVNMPAAMTTSNLQDATFSSMPPTENLDTSTSADMVAGQMSAPQPASTDSDSSGGSGPANYQKLVIAHASLLGSSFAFLMPLAVLLIRFGGRYAFYLHLGVNSLAILAILAGFPIAIYMSAAGEYNSFTQGHQIVGIIAVSSLLLIQPITGWTHHIQGKKTGQRNIISHIHMWVGRIVVALGIINIILGCLLSGDTEIAEGTGTAALFLYVVIFSVAGYMGFKKHRQPKNVSPDMSQRG